MLLKKTIMYAERKSHMGSTEYSSANYNAGLYFFCHNVFASEYIIYIEQTGTLRIDAKRQTDIEQFVIYAVVTFSHWTCVAI